MAIIYKILCEVKLMHEYYLTGSKGETVFDEALQDDRILFLQDLFARGARSVSNDIAFVPPDSYADVFEHYHLRILPSYSGFRLAVRCRRSRLDDGTTVYEPFIPLPDDLRIPVLMQPKNNIGAISAIPAGTPLLAAWFFTNDDFPAARAFPFLAAPVPAFDAGKTYEQGELASFGIGGIRVFLNNGAADPWLSLNGTGYISEADRVLMPLRMAYAFPAGSNITEATFTLSDFNGNIVKQISIIKEQPVKTVWLDFHTESSAVRTVPKYNAVAENLYSLFVTGTNGYSQTLSLMFADEGVHNAPYAAMICLKPRAPLAAFSLLDNAGRMQTRINPDNSRVSPPVFELWMKSRLVYWHYRHNERKKLKLMADTQDLLLNDNGVLVSKDPRPLSYQAVTLKKPDNTFQFLPNPTPGEPVNTSSTKHFVNIMVPASKLFPLE